MSIDTTILNGILIHKTYTIQGSKVLRVDTVSDFLLALNIIVKHLATLTYHRENQNSNQIFGYSFWSFPIWRHTLEPLRLIWPHSDFSLGTNVL